MLIFLNGKETFIITGGGSDELYRSTDWQTFQVHAALPTGSFREHYISENGNLYFIRNLEPTDASNIVEFTNGVFELRSGGRHVHIINEYDHKIYISDCQWTNTSMIRVLDTQWDNLDSATISVAGHSAIENSSLMYQGKFTFLYDYYTPDILQLDGTVLAINNLSSVTEEVYPNPVPSGGILKISSNTNSDCQLTSTSGKVILSQNLFKGENILNISELNPGVYFLNTGNSIHRIVVL